MLSLLLVLCLATTALSAERGSCRNPDRLIDQLLESAKKDKQADSAELDNVDVRIQYPQDVLQEGKIYVSEGKLSGMARQTRRQGKARILEKRGPICIVEAMIKYPSLQVKYEKAEIETNPDQRIKAQSYEGELKDIEAYLRIGYNEQSGEMRMKYYKALKSQGGQMTMKGAEERQKRNPLVSRQIRRRTEKAVGEALREHMEAAIKKQGRESSH